jgi:hypothetical protein
MSKSLKLEGTSDDLLKILFGFMSSLTPLVHLSDLVQNGIDAEASTIKIEIIRKGKTSKIENLVITDNGHGFLESFENYSKHIADSLKKKLLIYGEKKQKGELGGEYGIGMQGFRSVSSELQVINLTKAGIIGQDKDGNVINDPDFSRMLKCRRMRMLRDKQEVVIDEEREFENVRMSCGVTYILSGLTSNAEKAFTVPNITQFLSNAKRTYLLKIKKLKIEVVDGVTTEQVIPFSYKGEKKEHRITLPNQDKDTSRRGFGEIQGELYYHDHPKKGSKIVVTVKGEPIYLDLCQKIDGFDKYPWNSGLVEGTIEYERLSKQPGRVEVQRDQFYDAFIEMLKILEKEVDKKAKEIEKNYQTKQDEKLIDKLEEVFGKIKREIDLDIFGPPDKKTLKGSLARIQPYQDKENVEAFGKKTLYIKATDNEDNELTEGDGIEFSWKVTGKLGTITPKGNEAIFDAGSIVGITEVAATAKDKNSLKELSCKIEIVITYPIACGPLYRVKIMPGVVTVSVNKQRVFHAISEDVNGNVISKGVKYFWKIVYDNSEGAKINKDWGEAIIYTAGKRIGQVKLHLKAQQGKITKEDFALIDVAEPRKTEKSKKKTFGLPPPQRINDPVTHPMWHSRLDDKEKVLYYNEAHRDYIEVKNDGSKRQRYIANLYAKELALLECKPIGIEHYGERFIEVLSRLDKYWR